MVVISGRDALKGHGSRPPKAGRLEEVASGLYLVHATREGRIPYAHSLLALGRKNILVDTGLGPDVICELRRKHHIDLVLNSHYHRDHNWGNYLFKGVPIRIHRLDAPMLNSLAVYFRKMGIAGRGDERDIRKFTLAFIPHRQGPRAGTFSDGDVFGFGGPELETVHLPGHSPGHCGFYHRESRTLFSADICPDAFGPWYGHACSSAEDFARSVDRIVRLGPKKLLTAHTAPVGKDIAATLRRYKARIAERDRHIRDILTAPATIDELIGRHPLYGPYLWGLRLPYRFWEEMMVQKHVIRLLGQGMIMKEGARYRAL